MCVDKICNLRWYDDDVWLCNAENLLFKYETNQMMFNSIDAMPFRAMRYPNVNEDNFAIFRITNESEFDEMNLLNSMWERVSMCMPCHHCH